MTTSNYLKAQVDIMIALDILRKAPLEEILRTVDIAMAEGSKIIDTKGKPVVTNLEEMKRIMELFIALRNSLKSTKPRPKSLFTTTCVQCGGYIESSEKLCKCEKCGLEIEMIWPNATMTTQKGGSYADNT